MDLLIPYIQMRDEEDPLFEEFTYGDVKQRAKFLKTKLQPGDFVFFHTGKSGKKTITAYYVVEQVMNTADAVKDSLITDKYHNPHILRHRQNPRLLNSEGDVILFGNPITSRILDKPLPFNRALAQRLSLNIPFPSNRSEFQSIASATRAWRELTRRDVRVLRDAIRRLDKDASRQPALRSTEEVAETLERDIELYIARNPHLVELGLRLDKRQVALPVGRTDIHFIDGAGNLVVVELKLGYIGHDALRQLRRYLDELRKRAENENRDIRGVLICAGVLPSYRDELEKVRDVRILKYGWQLCTRPWQQG